jgi:hypothetical protein
MKRFLILIPVIAVGGCSAISSTVSGDAAACAAALVAGGIANPAGIPALALATPACTRLAKDALDAAIAAAQQQVPAAQMNARRMVR